MGLPPNEYHINMLTIYTSNYFQCLTRAIFLICFLGVLSCSQTPFPEIAEIRHIPVGDDVGYSFEWSPDKSHIAYLRDDRKEVVVLWLADNHTQVISPAGSTISTFGLRWSPDSRMLIYGLNNDNLCLAEQQAHEQEHWASTKWARITGLFWRDNNEWLHAESGTHDNLYGNMSPSPRTAKQSPGVTENCDRNIIYDLETGTSRTILAGIFNWSPDGTLLAGRTFIDRVVQFAIVRVSDSQILYRNRSARLWVTDTSSAPHQEFMWSPNSKYVVYAVDDEDNPDQARLVDVEASTQTILEAANSEHYTWSPDSTRLAYFRVNYLVGTGTGILSVYVYSLTTSEVQQLAQLDLPSASYSWPTWSPNGEFLALTFYGGLDYPEELERGTNDLALINTRSGEIVTYQVLEITQRPAWIRWSQDSQSIYLHGDSEILEVVFSGRE